MTLTHLIDEPDQEKRIAKLREEIEKLGGSSMSFETMPADMEEEFLRHVLEYETAQPISLFTMLENCGVEVPPPAEVSDAHLPSKLKEILKEWRRWGLFSTHESSQRPQTLRYLYTEGCVRRRCYFPRKPELRYMIDSPEAEAEEKINQIFEVYAGRRAQKTVGTRLAR